MLFSNSAYLFNISESSMGAPAGVKLLAMLKIDPRPMETASAVFFDIAEALPRLRTLSNLLSKNSQVASLLSDLSWIINNSVMQ